MRLDKYISQVTDLSRKDVKRLLRSDAVTVDGQSTRDGSLHISAEMDVCLEGEPLPTAGARYYMMHKPTGYVSVTKDQQHPTVLELMDEARLDRLQIAGRLDIDASGLLLITDDGAWNHAVTSPRRACEKTYHVTLAEDISADAEQRFAEGILLDGELNPTLPAKMEKRFSNEATLTIQEGKYHQVKRMFAALGNRVTELHRTQIGAIQLDPELQPGEYRPLTTEEIESVQR